MRRAIIVLTNSSVKNIVIVTIKESGDKPVKCSAGFFTRVGPNSQKMTRNEIILFIQSEGKIRFDELILSKIKFPRDLETVVALIVDEPVSAHI